MSQVALIPGETSGVGAAIVCALQAAGYRAASTMLHDGQGGPSRRKPASPLSNGMFATTTPASKVSPGRKKPSGQIGILVNNAGITRDAMFHKMTLQQWSRMTDTDLNRCLQYDASRLLGHA